MKNLFKRRRERTEDAPEEEKAAEEAAAGAADGAAVEPAEEERERRTVRHTISAEETFTLAKDVYDLRSFFKSVYANRAVIARRLNLFSLICSLVFTMFYVAFAIYSVLQDNFSLGLEITIYCLLGVYAVFVILLVLVTVFAGRVTTKTVKKYGKALKIFRFCIRVVSIAMAIVGIAAGTGKATGPAGVALETVLIIISVLLIIIQGIPLLFGGFSNLARWALAPAKGRARFSVVLFEWYELVRKGVESSPSTAKISPKYVNEINRCIDGYLIPALGKKYITDISAKDIYDTVDAMPDELDEIAEGVFMRVFAYALECGYVNHDPTKDMELEDSLREPEKKPRRTLKTRLMDWGKKIGKSIVKSYLDDDTQK